LRRTQSAVEDDGKAYSGDELRKLDIATPLENPQANTRSQSRLGRAHLTGNTDAGQKQFRDAKTGVVAWPRC